MPSSWVEKDLLDIISQQQRESLELEFKDALALEDKHRVNISKDISAFANAAGGILIYGIAESKDSIGIPFAAGLSGIDPTKMPREKLEQIINSNIMPRVSGIIIDQVILSDGLIAYVLNIPQAVSNAPHQAADQKYYRRHNFKIEPMYDYEIRDIMKRATSPEVHLKFKVIDNQAPSADFLGKFKMAVSAHNVSSAPALYYYTTIYVDKRLSANIKDFEKVDDEDIYGIIAGKRCEVTLFRRSAEPTRSTVLFRESPLAFPPITLNVPEPGNYYFLGYRISTPGCLKKETGVLFIKDGKIHIELVSDSGASPDVAGDAASIPPHPR